MEDRNIEKEPGMTPGTSLTIITLHTSTSMFQDTTRATSVGLPDDTKRAVILNGYQSYLRYLDTVPSNYKQFGLVFWSFCLFVFLSCLTGAERDSCRPEAAYDIPNPSICLKQKSLRGSDCTLETGTHSQILPTDYPWPCLSFTIEENSCQIPSLDRGE